MQRHITGRKSHNICKNTQVRDSHRLPEMKSRKLSPNQNQTGQRIQKLMAKIESEAVTTKWGGKKPASYAHPLLRDGDTDPTKGGDSNYAGCYFLNAKANADHPPKILDARCNPVMDRDEVYSGCYANVKVSIYAYNNPKGGKGLSAGLVAVQKKKDGARLGGDTGTDGFVPLSQEDEDMLS